MEEKDADRDVCIYDGIISNVPSSVSHLNKQQVRYLRAVLLHHGILSVGTKEELIICFGLLKCGQQQAVFSRERKALVELISIFKEFLGVERKQNRQGLLTRKRVNASNEMSTREEAGGKKETICPPQKMESLSVTETLDFSRKKIVLEEKDAIHLQKILPGFREILKWPKCKKIKDSRFFHKTTFSTKS